MCQIMELIMTLSDLQKTYDLPDFKGLLTLAKEKGFTDYSLANCIKFLFKVHKTHILRSLSSIIEHQQIVINTLIDIENKERFITYVNQCIEQGIPLHNLTITNWEEFIEDLDIIYKKSDFEEKIQKLQDIIYLRTGSRVPVKYQSILDPLV